ncbi:zinc finger, CCHC-type containing protein [Tanacetum coccineum]
MSVVYVLTTPMSNDGGENPTVEQNVKTSKELWDTLEAKYMAEDASSKNVPQDNDKPKGNNVAGPSVVNMVEHNNSSKYNDKKGKPTELMDQAQMDQRMVLQTLLKDDDVTWWVDSGATVHVAVVRLPDPKLKTLGERGIECIFVGYVEHSKAFRFYVIEPNDSVAINSIIESRDAIFDEQHVGGELRWTSKRVTDEIVQQSEPELRNSKRHRTPKDFGPEFQLYLIEGTRDEVSDQHSYCFNVEDDPKTFDEAMKSQDVAFWKEEINDEIDSIMDNNTWVLTDLPPGCRPLGCKWIFKRKLKVDGTVEKFKARLSDNSSDGCEDNFLECGTGIGAKLMHLVKESSFAYMLMTLIFGTDQVQVDLTKEFLSSMFSMKDTGEADVILGIKIKHESNGIAISQSYYIEKVLKKFNYSDCTLVSTPLDTYEKLMPNRGLAVSQLKYSRVIGCLMYVMTCTKPDIAFAVGKLRRYTSNPGTQHLQAIQRVLMYLKKTIDYILVYSGYPSVLEGYTNVSWMSNTEDNSSTSGWVFLLGGGTISWAFKKQTCITGSIMESEFVALAAAGKEAEWLKNLLLKITLWVKPMAPISIRCDSTSTLAKVYSQMYNGSPDT